MKKFLLILFSISLFACNNNYNKEKESNERRKNDSLRNINNEQLIKEMNDEKTARMEKYEKNLIRVDKCYSNLVGRWVLNETNYLSTLNRVVRIYKID